MRDLLTRPTNDFDRLDPVNLGPRTTFKIGGRARRFYTPRTVEELSLLMTRLADMGEKPFILGGGANVLFPDGDYERPVICTSALDELTVKGTRITAAAGVRLGKLIQKSLRLGLGGLEVFVGIPGTCGGAVNMNAGGRGWAFGERVTELGVLSPEGSVEILKGSDVDWEYRTANLDGAIVLWVTVELGRASPLNLRRRAGLFMRQKVATQPLHAASAGCIFRNPPGYRAGELIERIGLKGTASGGARISPCHANFIVNEGKATANDVKSLVRKVQNLVETQFGIQLETEVVLA